MSTTIMAQCWPLQMEAPRKAVLISLADNANDQGECWPSLKKIGERTCLGKTSIAEALRWLEDHGAISRERSRGGFRTHYVITPASYTKRLVTHGEFLAARAAARQQRNNERSRSCASALDCPPDEQSAGRTIEHNCPPGEPELSVSRTSTVRVANSHKSNRHKSSRTVTSARSVSSKMAPGWAPSATTKARAVAEYPNVDLAELTKYLVNECKAKGTRSADWDATWINRVASAAARGTFKAQKRAMTEPQVGAGSRTARSPSPPVPRETRDEGFRITRAFLDNALASGLMTPEDHATEIAALDTMKDGRQSKLSRNKPSRQHDGTTSDNHRSL